MSNTIKTLKVGEQTEVKVRSWMFGKTKERGTKYVKILFDNYIEKTIWPWSPKAQEHAMQTLETLGFQGANLSMLSNDHALNRDKYFMVTIDNIRQYNGKNYYEASWINDPDKMMGGFMENKLTADELDEYSLDVSGYIENAQDIETPAATSQEYTATETNFASDQIPF